MDGLDFGSDNVHFLNQINLEVICMHFLLTQLPFPNWGRTDWFLIVIQYHAAVYMWAV